MFDINHENPVMLIEEQYKKLFGQKIEKYDVMKNMNGGIAYFTSKTTSIGRMFHGILIVDILSAICDADPECVGFNSEGALFTQIHPIAATGIDLYVKKN